ncbi:GDSL-type esterase/lipase family protein [Thalassotalea psychrophila]|uniref:GDSL-type esterase/lipase family protein n=1 Tax=Thalassotalea psychrophila TaxID=3065647 RepID=A0ABY9TW54_9GAMM|nr:GDSL-type esterase/lipase family protein [Colwelliaceae bacterium SQ149]
MMNLKHLFITTALIAFAAITPAMAAKTVDLANDNIRYLGTNYVYHQNKQVSFSRHNKGTLAVPKMKLAFNPEKAQTTSGIVVNLATKSQEINFEFIPLPKENRGSEFALYENDTLVKTFKFKRKDKKFLLNYKSDNSQYKEYRLTLPSWSNVALQSITLDDDSEILAIKTPRKAKYVAIGDSITHGVGQGSATHLTYPYIVSQALDLELYNIAVGGGKTSIPTAEMLKDFDDIKLITLLIGYNDWNSPKADVKQYQSNIDEILSIIRKYHPETQIYCITPLFTKTQKAKHIDQPIQAYRQAVIDVVKAKQLSGDINITVIEGDEITSAKNLREDNPKDPVHLGVNGARMLAEELTKLIK